MCYTVLPNLLSKQSKWNISILVNTCRVVVGKEEPPGQTEEQQVWFVVSEDGGDFVLRVEWTEGRIRET